MQLRDSSSGIATDGADQHTRCGRGEETPIAPEPNSSGKPAPDLEERKPAVPQARALFDYVASPDDSTELSFKQGEIFDVLDSSAEWWRVKKADGSTGFVPSNFVRRCHDRKRDSRFQAQALYDYHGQPEDVSFTKGEIVDVLDDSEDWWEVRKACGSEGQAPSNYLQKLVTPGLIRAEALYDYRAAFDDPEEVSFSKLDIFNVLDSSGDWWTVRKADGRTGIAPSNFLRVFT
ncbi:uncharacterized protein LACBIDRAFT_300506 [Laccaria bicolor S238N-H82]|uniref:Predicted protein n=1 Tax=Laccaria bicolor (strain S238N-H82 / ATCC MYA-4686) TaxID=486041 RepID=B0DGX6_LACBS|nr:uncharacterized protein LACBIDRAFT_300506 [Laccaria bicolor S238N-H82]EDR06350.1 predicted protein [Laccaria bicolor S238N-H82]|eukprot:XP_001883211.1 predicted protein [Laccaria bicolor S238N-H82]